VQSRYPIAGMGTDTFVMNVATFNNGPGYILHGQSVLESGYQEYIASAYKAEVSKLLTVGTGGSIVTYDLSPNDRYIVTDILSSEDGKSTHVLRVIDMRTRKTILEIDGTNARWQ
ncbi:MAG: hypothetical protein ACRDL7_10455, partial [Gaiellaceae bacterium]